MDVSDQIKKAAEKVVDNKPKMEKMREEGSANLQKTISDSLKNPDHMDMLRKQGAESLQYGLLQSLKDEMMMNSMKNQGKALSREILGDDQVKKNVAAVLSDYFISSINDSKVIGGGSKSLGHGYCVGLVNDPAFMDPIRENGKAKVQEMLNDNTIMGPILLKFVAPIAVPLCLGAAVEFYRALRGK